MAQAPDSTICLINFENNIIDITNNSSVLNNGVTLSSDQAKFGTNSGYFNYSNKNNIILSLSSEAKTISLWFYPTGNTTADWYPTIWSSRSTTAAGGTYTHIDDGSYSNYPVYRSNESGSLSNNGTYGSTIITKNTWHHYAYSTQGDGTHYFFLDGKLQATVTQSNPYTLDIIALGGLLQSSNNLVDGCYFSGYMDEILICSECLYTADFSVPTEAWEYTGEINPVVNIASSSNYGTYYGNISNLTDGDTSTYWWTNNAQSESQFVLFTFNRPVIFNGITTQTLVNTGDCISSGTVLQVSFDGSTWTTIGNFTGEPVCTFENLNIVNVSHIRIYVETSSNKWLCVNEITLDYIEPPLQNLYKKINGSWVYIQEVYEKENGTWVKKYELKDLFNDNIEYIMG